MDRIVYAILAFNAWLGILGAFLCVEKAHTHEHIRRRGLWCCAWAGLWCVALIVATVLL